VAQAEERVGLQHLHGREPALGPVLRQRSLARHSRRIAFFSSFRSKNWKKALAGKLDPRNILRMMVGGPLKRLLHRPPASAQAAAPDPFEELQKLTRRGVRLFHLYCEGDEGLDYFHVVLGRNVARLEQDGLSRVRVLKGANHVFTMLWSQDRLRELVLEWAADFPRGPAAAAPATEGSGGGTQP